MVTPDLGVEYRQLVEAMSTMLNEGYQPDALNALIALKSAHKTLSHSGKAKTGKQKQRGGGGGVAEKIQIWTNVLVAIWKGILYPYTQPMHYEHNGFKRKFTMHGMEGYKTFLN